ncbi:hypothetical protein HRQ91_08695 [Treponema parvum]|uniref:Transketolase N-terminal domain-containing protein n=1 Tax=Treponema parvum TaxID=138851 RepID=A0A975F4Z5_9SPIR|nr:1-deoxy-D-xylulose-5-phosphate synthase N-terminal domain-containing protein [Treponema parvum]QTQ14526.1 hypothetical protein HRQ91_08695 [Treponema parvum]
MEEISRKLRKTALYLSHKCKDGNLQSVFSCLDIMWVLYDRVMNWSPEKALDDDRDFFIISKGQATLALYPILIEKGMFNLKDIASEIGNFDSRYCIQTDLTKFSGGIENNAGSLGHGLPFGTGIAYANKIKKSRSNVYVLCGDGELCEGTMWESFIFAGDKHLDNLCVIIDDNDSVKAMVSLNSISEKLRSFNFDTFEVNGHDMNECESILSGIKKMNNGKPKAVIAHTIRGYGSKTMTEHEIWFHKAPNESELVLLNKEVDEF